MRLAIGAVLLVLTATACHSGGDGGSGGGHATADCAAPLLTTDPSQLTPVTDPVLVVPDQQLTVYGRYYARDCVDNGIGHEHAMTEVRLALVDTDGRTVQLATAHPGGDQFAFEVTVTVPGDTPLGTAELTDQQPQATATIPLRVMGRA